MLRESIRVGRTALLGSHLLIVPLVAGQLGCSDEETGALPPPTTTSSTTDARLVAVDVTPTAAAIDEGDTQAFSAVATYEDQGTRDVSSSCSWDSSDETVATVDGTGVASGLVAGQAVVTATFQGLSDVAELTVRSPWPSCSLPQTDWEVRTPAELGVDGTALDEALAYLESESGQDGIEEVVVIRNGCLIWRGTDIDNAHSTWSVGKVFTSTALGLLVEDGLCTLSDLVSDVEPALASDYGQVTHEHFATMTSGYDGAGGPRWASPTPTYGDWSATPYQPGTPLFAPGTDYLYWDEAMMMFARALTRIAGEDLYELLDRRIAQPIGMTWDWETEGTVDGITIRQGSGMVIVSARELARFGQLFLRRGRWNDQQLVSEAWVDTATQSHVPTGVALFETTDWNDDHLGIDGRGVYGYHWWTNGIKADSTRDLPDAPLGTFYRTGYNHNMLVIIPEWHMVIVRLGVDGTPDNRMEIWNEVLRQIGAAMLDP